MERVVALAKELEMLIKFSSRVFIVGHNNPDYDALGSAMGLQVLARSYGKSSFIVVDDDKLSTSIEKLKNQGSSLYQIVDRDTALRLRDNGSLLILTDVNKRDMISLSKDLHRFNNVMIIDHHKSDENTVSTPHTYIDLDASSASEVVTILLALRDKALLTPELSSILYTGMALDTNRFKYRLTDTTTKVKGFLERRGASLEEAQRILEEGFEDSIPIAILTDQADYKTNNIKLRVYMDGDDERIVAYTLNRNNPHMQYSREELAISADELLQATAPTVFSLGYTDSDVVTVSGRSIGEIDVAEVLRTHNGLVGGGSPNSAGARCTSLDILEVEEEIDKSVQKVLTLKMEKER